MYFNRKDIKRFTVRKIYGPCSYDDFLKCTYDVAMNAPEVVLDATSFRAVFDSYLTKKNEYGKDVVSIKTRCKKITASNWETEDEEALKQNFHDCLTHGGKFMTHLSFMRSTRSVPGNPSSYTLENGIWREAFTNIAKLNVRDVKKKAMALGIQMYYRQCALAYVAYCDPTTGEVSDKGYIIYYKKREVDTPLLEKIYTALDKFGVNELDKVPFWLCGKNDNKDKIDIG